MKNDEFIVKYRNFPVKFIGLNGARKVYELTTRAHATGFADESSAWQAVKDYGIKVTDCTVKARG